MAAPRMNLKLDNAVVAFAVLTGEGRKGKKSENEYTLAVEVTKKQKRDILKQVNEFWEENKPKKAKKPKEDPEKWFSESQDNKGDFVFWASEIVSKSISLERAKGTTFGMKHFKDLGAGSVVDASYSLFLYDNSYGTGIGLRLSVVLLKEFVKHTGNSTLGGEKIDDDDEGGVATEDEMSEVISDFEEALEDKDFDDAEELLEELEDHADYKKFKKAFKKAKKNK